MLEKRIKDDIFGFAVICCQAGPYLYRSGYRQGPHPILHLFYSLIANPRYFIDVSALALHVKFVVWVVISIKISGTFSALRY